MLRLTTIPGSFAVVAIALAAVGCTAPTSETEENTNTDTQAIVNGTTASTHQEAVLVDMYQGGQLTAACSGSLIAPRVVLTAGHCVQGFDSWQITAPFHGNDSSTSSSGKVLDYPDDGSESVPTDAHDVGLIFLDDAIQIDQFPKLATKGLADGSSVVNIGRIRNGQLSNSSLFVSKSIKVKSAEADGFPYDYEASEIIESGDSGGPVELTNKTGVHTIVAVNSGAGGGTEVLARVDLVSSWIQKQIKAHR